jgi:transposase
MQMQMQIAAERVIQPSMLRQWRAVLNGAAPRSRLGTLVASLPAGAVASPSDRAAEIARLRRELDQVRIERDVLEKAIGIFLGDAKSEVGFIEQHACTWPVASRVPRARRLDERL